MDPIILAGAWAAAILSCAALIKLAYTGAVKGIRAIFQQELQRVWRDMDDIENRLTALETSVALLRIELSKLLALLVGQQDRKG